MAWFTAFRGDFGNAYYGEYRTSVTADISFAAIAYTCVLISIAAIVAAAGIRGREVSGQAVKLLYTFNSYFYFAMVLSFLFSSVSSSCSSS
ncbi:hypothetical protein DPMN_076173 [Dreissena polymorpha]|uniref:Uncharacterized protein n=1 Tax=Dreissena polymorpha TaxID=45954 RepID=A0A9D4BFJ4_DREPO|nr:hypothetical protein DPMN_076173 [Dreissena polymorpha]